MCIDVLNINILILGGYTQKTVLFLSVFSYISSTVTLPTSIDCKPQDLSVQNSTIIPTIVGIVINVYQWYARKI